MMKIYLQPMAEVLNLSQEDVIRTSTEPTPPPVEQGDNLFGVMEVWN